MKMFVTRTDTGMTFVCKSFRHAPHVAFQKDALRYGLYRPAMVALMPFAGPFYLHTIVYFQDLYFDFAK